MRTPALTIMALLAAATLTPAAAHAAPANDDFSNAEELSGFVVRASGSNVDATKQPGEPKHAGDDGGHSVWWHWTVAADQRVAISTCGSDFDTLLAVYTGVSASALTEVVSDDDENCAGGSVVRFDAVAGQTYRIAADGAGGDTGEITLRLRPVPGNDDFAGNGGLGEPLPIMLQTHNVGATKEPQEPDHAGAPGGHSIWVNWTPGADGPVTATTCGSDFDTVLAVYTGSDVAALTEVASNDDAPGNGCASKVTFAAAAGTTYRIAVDGAGGANGEITLSLGNPPANDNFLDAAPIGPALPATASGTNVGATKEPGEPDHTGDPGGRSVWWSWTAPAAEAVELSTCGSSFDTTLAVYTGASASTLTEVASNDDACGLGSRASFVAGAGQTYHIAVDGFSAETGDIALEIRRQPPENPLYLALGDSVSRGDGAPAGLGFVDLYHAHLRGPASDLQLLNLAQGGETSSTMRANGQLDEALAAIGRPSDTRVVTLGIGGNDGTGGQCPAGFNTGPCPFKDNYTAILQALRSALDNDPGDETFKVLQYYNPAAGTGRPDEAVYEFGLLGSDGKVDCAGSGYAVGLNDHVACIGRDWGAMPIDTHPTFKAGGPALMADSFHPNSTGHAYIACLFEHPDRAGSPRPCEPTPPSVPQPDPLQVTVTAAARQRVVRQRGVVLFLSANKDADASASAIVRLPRIGARRGRSAASPLRLTPRTIHLAPDTRTRVKLAISRKGVRVLRRALRVRKRLVTRITVRATDASGESRVVLRRINLVR